MERTEIDAVRQMPLADFLARLGYEPVRRSGNELWYLAPYRGERTPSFRVNVAKQLWYDFGLGKGGDIFTLAGEFLQSDDFMKQAKFIAEAANMTVAGWEKPVYLSVSYTHLDVYKRQSSATLPFPPLRAGLSKPEAWAVTVAT